jgi:hypothetical protein
MQDGHFMLVFPFWFKFHHISLNAPGISSFFWIRQIFAGDLDFPDVQSDV